MADLEGNEETKKRNKERGKENTNWKKENQK